MSDSDEEQCSIAKRPRKGDKERCSSGDSAFSFGKYSVPSATSGWNTSVLDGLAIFYSRDPLSSPLDILDKVYCECKTYGPLSDEQKHYVKDLQDSMKYNITLSHIAQKYSDDSSPIYAVLKEIYNDSENGNNFPVKRFLKSTHRMLMFQQLRRDRCSQYRGVPVQEAIFSQMFESFVEMCELDSVPGIAMSQQMIIKKTTVKATGDILVMSTPFLKEDITRDDLLNKPILALAEIKNLTCYLSGRKKQNKPKSKQSRTIGSPPTESQTPAIYNIIPGEVLGQFAGELLTHYHLYPASLIDGNVLYILGMIVIGTEVTFGLLEISEDHLTEIQEDGESMENKSYIHYSEPKDLLKKEDRDILIEAFFRLHNQSLRLVSKIEPS